MRSEIASMESLEGSNVYFSKAIAAIKKTSDCKSCRGTKQVHAYFRDNDIGMI
jgi:hypothetical protein